MRILNALVFTEDGEDGNFTGAAVNTGDEDVELTLQYLSDGDKVNVDIEVPAGETVQIGSGENGQVFLPAIDALPGTLLPIYFQYGALPGKQAGHPGARRVVRALREPAAHADPHPDADPHGHPDADRDSCRLEPLAELNCGRPLSRTEHGAVSRCAALPGGYGGRDERGRPSCPNSPG